MTDQEIIKLFLETKEWQAFECKRAAIQPSKLLETIVAFANSDGGYIIVGLEDPNKAKEDRRLIGISENEENVSEVLKLIDKEIDPQLKLWSKFELDIKNIHGYKDKLLVISIKKSNDVHSLKKGDTFIRKGKQNVKIGSSEIIRLKYEKGALRFEDENTTIDNLDDINNDLLKEYKKETQSQNQNDRQFLKDNGLVIKEKNKFFLTKACILLFGKNPTVTLKCKSGIKISHYYGTKPSYTGEPNFVRRPFTIESPGSYPGHITVSNIRSERYARNPLILRTLNRFQDAPNLDIGEGVDRIFKVMKEKNLYEPLYYPPTIRPNSVLLVLFNLQRMEYWDTVSKYLDEHYRLSNSDARSITGIVDTLKMSRLLNSWVSKGLLERIGKGYKGNMYYRKPGGEVPQVSFSSVVENKQKK